MVITNQSEIPGFCDFKSLYEDLGSEIPDGSGFAEIGVYQGASLCIIAAKTKELGKNCKFYAIDTWKKRHTYNQFFSHAIAYGVNSAITPMRGPSDIQLLAFPAYPLEYKLWGCMIDGDHSYQTTRRDIELVLDRVSDVILGHDIQLFSVKKAVLDTVGEAHEVVGNCWIYRKNKEKK